MEFIPATQIIIYMCIKEITLNMLRNTQNYMCNLELFSKIHAVILDDKNPANRRLATNA